MKTSHRTRIVRLVAASAAALLLAIAAPTRAEEGCSNDKCHSSLMAGKVRHPAADSCDSCHESTSSPHPQKGKKTFKLTAEVPGLCGNCHDAFGKKKVVHPPVKDGSCTTCHDPHSSAQPKLLVSPMKELCGMCHGDHLEFKVLHGPVSAGECTACHSPHESDEAKLLLKPGDKVCFDCHTDFPDLLKKKHVHPALESGCTSCHNPHGSAQPKMLADVGGKVCFGCHGEIGEKVEKATVPHPPVQSEKGCVSCHSPHASDGEKLLPKGTKELCLDCHKTVLKKAMTSFHGPIRDGKCGACHDIHGGGNPKLLVRPFPAGQYVPYTDTEYPLCFGCHKRELLQYAETSFATDFRDGQKNLHFVHVNNKQKGRSCRMCHEFHGAANSKLVAESVPFGKWELPLKFVKTETGGGCSPGCHRPLWYDRKTPGKKPEPAKTAASPKKS